MNDRVMFVVKGIQTIPTLAFPAVRYASLTAGRNLLRPDETVERRKEAL